MEFAYNNVNYSSIQMALFKDLYGRHCRIPVSWFESSLPRPHSKDLLQAALARVQVIQDRLRTAQSKQQNYADHRHCPLYFGVDDRVVL